MSTQHQQRSPDHAQGSADDGQPPWEATVIARSFQAFNNKFRFTVLLSGIGGALISVHKLAWGDVPEMVLLSINGRAQKDTAPTQPKVK